VEIIKEKTVEVNMRVEGGGDAGQHLLLLQLNLRTWRCFRYS